MHFYRFISVSLVFFSRIKLSHVDMVESNFYACDELRFLGNGIVTDMGSWSRDNAEGSAAASLQHDSIWPGFDSSQVPFNKLTSVFHASICPVID